MLYKCCTGVVDHAIFLNHDIHFFSPPLPFPIPLPHFMITYSFPLSCPVRTWPDLSLLLFIFGFLIFHKLLFLQIVVPFLKMSFHQIMVPLSKYNSLKSWFCLSKYNFFKSWFRFPKYNFFTSWFLSTYQFFKSWFRFPKYNSFKSWFISFQFFWIFFFHILFHHNLHMIATLYLRSLCRHDHVERARDELPGNVFLSPSSTGTTSADRIPG